MAFTRKAVLNKYFKNITQDTSQFCEDIHRALEEIVYSKKIAKLTACLALYQNNLNTEIFYQCLLATKAYLNSSDFQFYGKFESRNLFFSGIRYVSESSLLKDIKNEIENFIYKNTQRTSIFSSIYSLSETVMSSGYQLVKSGWEFVSCSPIKLGATLLYYQTSLADAFPIGRSYAENSNFNMNITLSPRSLLNSNTRGLTKNEKAIIAENPMKFINKFYHVHNTTSLDKVEIFLFGEIHHNATHQYLQEYYINYLAEYGDYYFLEGASMDHAISCSNQGITKPLICKGWENWELYKEVREGVHGSQRKIDSELVLFNDYSNQVKAGIEKSLLIQKTIPQLMKLLNKAKGINNRHLPLLDKIEKLKEEAKWVSITCSKVKSPSCMAEKREEINGEVIDVLSQSFEIQGKVSRIQDKIVKKYNKMGITFSPGTITTDTLVARAEKLKADLDANIARTNKLKAKRNEVLYGSDILHERNKGIITSLKRVEHSNKRKFVVAGIDHFVPQRSMDRGLFKVKKKDDQYALRKYVKKKPHAILFAR